MTRVAHVITGLRTGGAEIMLDHLLGALDSQRIHSEVICLAENGPIGDRIQSRHVPLQVLGLAAGPTALGGLPRLVAGLRDIRPHVVHTWMYHADFLGGTAARVLGIPVVWALHSSTLDPVQTRRSTRWLVRALARLSGYVPTRIVSCSSVGRTVHENMGYDGNKLSVIPNGFDTQRFRKDDDLRAAARARWGVTCDAIVVGHVARFHPQKDHKTLLEAAALSLNADARLRFVLLGTNVDAANETLKAYAQRLQITDRCLFLGATSAVNAQLPGLDLLVSSSSYGEAFPLVIGEAMACEVPCVVTDVGDSAFIVGDTGSTAPPANPKALASGILRIAQLAATERQRLGVRARARIEANFSLPLIASLYTATYEAVAATAAKRLKFPPGAGQPSTG